MRSYVVVSGVDAGALCTFSNASIEDPTFTCTDDGTYRVTLRASEVLTQSYGSADVVVNNLAPAVTITGPASGSIYPVGTPVTFTGTFTDPGTNDTHNFPCTTVGACTYWQFDTIKQAATVVETNGAGRPTPRTPSPRRASTTSRSMSVTTMAPPAAQARSTGSTR